MQENANRLKGYKANLVLFPRNAKKPKDGEASAEAKAGATQLAGNTVLPLVHAAPALEKVAITAEMKVRAAGGFAAQGLTNKGTVDGFGGGCFRGSTACVVEQPLREAVEAIVGLTL